MERKHNLSTYQIGSIEDMAHDHRAMETWKEKKGFFCGDN